jgi:hypothetical protein
MGGSILPRRNPVETELRDDGTAPRGEELEIYMITFLRGNCGDLALAAV